MAVFLCREELRAANLNAEGQGRRLYLRYLVFKLLKDNANLDTQWILDLFLLSSDIRDDKQSVKLATMYDFDTHLKATFADIDVFY